MPRLSIAALMPVLLTGGCQAPPPQTPDVLDVELRVTDYRPNTRVDRWGFSLTTYRGEIVAIARTPELAIKPILLALSYQDHNATDREKTEEVLRLLVLENGTDRIEVLSQYSELEATPHGPAELIPLRPRLIGWTPLELAGLEPKAPEPDESFRLFRLSDLDVRTRDTGARVSSRVTATLSSTAVEDLDREIWVVLQLTKDSSDPDASGKQYELVPLQRGPGILEAYLGSGLHTLDVAAAGWIAVSTEPIVPDNAFVRLESEHVNLVALVADSKLAAGDELGFTAFSQDHAAWRRSWVPLRDVRDVSPLPQPAQRQTDSESNRADPE